MDVRTGGPILHSIFCTLAGILFIAFFVSAAVGPAWWNTPDDYHYDSWLRPALTVVGIAIAFQIILGIWVGIDANRRGMNGFLWGALTCFTCVVGLIVYLISSQGPSAQPSRTRNTSAHPIGAGSSCPACGSPTRREFLACPHCGTSLQGTCPSCKAPIEPSWKFCPSCRSSLSEGTARDPTDGSARQG